MKLLVTGASGFVGRNVLIGMPRDWQVVATYRRDASFPEFLRAKGLVHVRAVRVDLTDERAGDALGERSFDACVHLAANGDPARSVEATAEDLRANALSVVNVLARCTFGHFVFFSSGAVYDGLQGEVTPASAVRPALPYAISKWAAERYVEAARKHGRIRVASIVRFFGAYGPYEPERKIYGRLVRRFAFEREPRFTIRGDGRNLIDAMYVDDAVAAVRAILEKPGESATFDLASGHPLTLRDLVVEAARAFGLEAEIAFEGAVPEYIEFRSADRTMAARYGFAPRVSLAEGLRRFKEWMAKGEPCPATKTA